MRHIYFEDSGMMKHKEIKDKLTKYYHTNEAYFDIMSYVRDAATILDVGCGSGALITF